MTAAENGRQAMADRTFHRKFTPTARVGVVVFSVLMFYCFWVKEVVPAVVCLLLVVTAIEKVLHSEYVFRGHDLIVRKGRFVKPRAIAVNEIVRCSPMRATFGLTRYLLIEYGQHSVEDVEPADEQAFLRELKRRQDDFDKTVARAHGGFAAATDGTAR